MRARRVSYLLRGAWVAAPVSLTGGVHVWAGLVEVTTPEGVTHTRFLEDGKRGETSLCLRRSPSWIPLAADPIHAPRDEEDHRLIELGVSLIHDLVDWAEE